MVRVPPGSTRTVTLFPYTPLFRTGQVSCESRSPESKAVTPITLGSCFRRSTRCRRLRARMRVAVDVHQMRGIDRGVDLRRAEAGMAEQFLERAQVGAAHQQEIGRAHV